MSRPLGGYIGYDAEPTTTAAPGIWTLREAELYQRKAQWPAPTPTFAPSDITGLQAWYDASDASTLYDATTGGSLVAADGGVARWEDKSGNGNHATQGTAGSRPARKTAIQGGLDVLRFDGSDDSLSVPSSTATFNFIHSEQATIFVAIKAGTTANPNVPYRVLTNWPSSGVGFAMAYDDRGSVPRNDNFNFLTVAGSSQFPISVATDNVFTANTFVVVGAVIDNTAASGADRIKHSKNGTVIANTHNRTDARSTANAAADLTIARIPSGTQYLHGDIAEILIYNSALSDTDREEVENYLLAKWGIT